MKKLLTIALLTLILSCSKKDDIQINSALECLGQVEISLYLSTCENNAQTTNDFYCEVITIGEFQLENSSKEFMVQACNNEGDIIKYENEIGEVIEFEVTKNRYTTVTSVYGTTDTCENDTSKTVGYCMRKELIQLVLKSTSPELELTIEIETAPDWLVVEVGPVGDFLKISRRKSFNSLSTEFKAVITKRTLSYDNSPFQEFFETIEILGEEYENVISNDINFDLTNTPKFKYFYNNTIGLIAFQDENKITWKLK
jgi:hypothetical protein